MKRTIVCLILGAAAIPAAELPVRQVVLYKHGVGYFERSGRLGAGESARLDFKAAEMNDVLEIAHSGREGRRENLGTALRFAGPAEPQPGAVSISHRERTVAEPPCSISSRARASS